MLRVRNLDVSYGPVAALRRVSLHVNPGEIATIIGANGAGKTTLLRSIAGLTPARGGEVLIAQALGAMLTERAPAGGLKPSRAGGGLSPEEIQLQHATGPGGNNPHGGQATGWRG